MDEVGLTPAQVRRLYAGRNRGQLFWRRRFGAPVDWAVSRNTRLGRPGLVFSVAWGKSWDFRRCCWATQFLACDGGRVANLFLWYAFVIARYVDRQALARLDVRSGGSCVDAGLYPMGLGLLVGSIGGDDGRNAFWRWRY